MMAGQPRVRTPDPRYAHYRNMPPAELRAIAARLGVDVSLSAYHDRRLQEIDHWARVAGTGHRRADHVLALELELGLREVVCRRGGMRTYTPTDRGVVLAVIRERRRQGIDVLAAPIPCAGSTAERPFMRKSSAKPTLMLASSIDTSALSVEELRALAYRLRLSRAWITLEATGYLEARRRMARAGHDTRDFPVNLYRYRKLASQIAASGELLQPGTRRSLRTEVALRIDQLEQRGIDVYGDGHAKRLRRMIGRRTG
jgi:hypothetical protein